MVAGLVGGSARSGWCSQVAQCQGWAELEPAETSSVKMWVYAAPLATDHWVAASQQLQP